VCGIPDTCLKHLHNVETRFYCSQTFLSLDFQCKDDISECYRRFGIEKSWLIPEQMLAQAQVNQIDPQKFCRQDLSKTASKCHPACTPHKASSALQDGNLLVPQYMAAQLDPSMGMDPSMEGTLQQEEEEDQYDNGLEDAIRQDQGDADQGVPPPSNPLPTI